ncbi:MAG: M28 family metallopeptidase [Phenylobacterium sp.]
MRRLSVLAVGFALLATAAAAQPTPEMQRSAEHVKAHMAFLASDLLEGREAGSRGFDIAAEYVASQFRQLGLVPGGDRGSYFQRVPLFAYRNVGEGTFVLRGPKGVEPLVYGEDYLPSRNPAAAETRVSAPLVFVGFGIVAPEHGRDDYKGLDVKGKIVVAMDGAPRAFQTEERAYYRSTRNKRGWAAQHGAVGFVSLNTPGDEKLYPFANSVKRVKAWSMTWRDPLDSPFVVAPSVPALAAVSVRGASKLFAGAPAPLEAIWAAGEALAGDPPRFALPRTLDAAFTTESHVVESRNVVGLIEGSDPVLKAQTVVLSAHLDHVGVVEGGKDDVINNGALDNAAGVATTLEVARAFMESGKRPKRSVLFLAVTGEEKGLLGAEYFARNPTVPLESIVADVDLDMPVLTYDFTDVVAFGADRSGIGAAVKRAAGRMGVVLSPDPMPDEGLFTRSDHYRFVEVGVPAVFLMTGFQNGGEAQFRDFLANRYHRPGDDLAQPIDYLAGAKFARLNYEITRELTDAVARPQWNAGDFFGEKFGKPAAALAATP